MISYFSTSTAALIGVISTSLVSSVKAQSSTGCVSLQGSTQCPSFQSQYINPQNLSTAWPWMSQVSDVISFDQQFALYWTDPNRFEQTKFHNQLQCNRTGSANVTIQWQRTVYCSMFTQISYSASCNSNVEPKMVCQDTCNQFSQSEYQIVQNSEICAPSSALTSQHNSTRYQTLVKDYTQCTNWTSLTSNNTQTCVEGSANEGNCGYGPYVGPQVCQACDPSSNNNNVPSCCTSANTDLRNCASYGYPGAARLAASSSSSSAGSSSQTGSNSAYNSKGGPDLSKGQLAGIIVGSIIGAMLLGALIAALLFARRKRKSDPESRRGAGGIYSAAGAASSGRTSTGEKPWHSEDHMSRRSLAGSPEMEKTGAGSSNNMINMSSLGAGAAGVGAAGLGAAALSSNNHRNYDNQRSGSPVGRPASQALTSSSGGDKSATVPMVRDQYTGQDIHVGEEVVAIYPYNASLNDELTLEPEQRVTVVRLYDDGWALGRTADGNEGALPLVCVSSTKGDLPGRRGAGGNGSGTATGTSDDEGMTSGAEYTSSVDGAVTAEEGGFTSDARSQRSRR